MWGAEMSYQSLPRRGPAAQNRPLRCPLWVNFAELQSSETQQRTASAWKRSSRSGLVGRKHDEEWGAR